MSGSDRKTTIGSGAAASVMASRSCDQHSPSDERTAWGTGIQQQLAAIGTSPVNLTSATSLNWRRTMGKLLANAIRWFCLLSLVLAADRSANAS